MFEKRHQPLLPLSLFIHRLLRNLLVGIALAGFSLFIGMIGYRHFEQMNWVDAFVNSAMILSGMGPVSTLYTDAGKIFAGIYALFSGIVFLITIAIIFAPLVHRFFHPIDGVETPSFRMGGNAAPFFRDLNVMGLYFFLYEKNNISQTALNSRTICISQTDSRCIC